MTMTDATQNDDFEDSDDSTSPFHTRDYHPADAPALAAVYRAAILETGRSAYSTEQCAGWATSAEDPTAWAQRLQDAWVRVAVDDTDEIVGFGGILMPGHIDLLFTAPDANRMGVASLILADLLELAAAMGAKQITTDACNLSKPFFEKHGFKLVESGEHCRCGQSLTCHRLVKG